ncbi:CCR4-NOT transcription complex subunit 1 [Vitis vinifera]|uniref:CCR4-NOT transcription complex subunit 1 n=1 Tax=Vitis vinifera TaxID=29760 RepID=A0A438BRQ8_VITVI|nr:CCR4-NOT transcription complex subunit 1 [Vitis vinifera]
MEKAFAFTLINKQFIEYGYEASILLLQTCLDHMNFHGGDMNDMQLKPDFSVSEKIGLGLALADSENGDVRTSGQNFCMRQIEKLCGNPASIDSHEKIQKIIMFLYQSEGLSKHVDSFMQMLSLMEFKERPPFVLAPLLSDDLHEDSFQVYDSGNHLFCLTAFFVCCRNLDLFYDFSENEFDSILAEMENDTSMADIMRELGYGCTLSTSHCKEVLSLFLPLSEVTLSRILSTIARTHAGLEDNQNSYSTFCSAIGSSALSDSSCLSCWNVDVLVDSIKQLAPGINWTLVMENLDHEGFYFPNEGAFSFFMSIYARACQDPFPLHAVCGSVWNNVDGQISFLRYAVAAPPETFTFAHSIRKLAYTDALHGQELPHGQANQAWLSLDLLDVLCQLAERGHAGSVRLMLEFPLKHCPEILLLGIAQINTAYNLIQREVSSTVFPMIIGNVMGSGVILHLWHSNPKL